jgi:hypothetical protein
VKPLLWQRTFLSGRQSPDVVRSCIRNAQGVDNHCFHLSRPPFIRQTNSEGLFGKIDSPISHRVALKNVKGMSRSSVELDLRRRPYGPRRRIAASSKSASAVLQRATLLCGSMYLSHHRGAQQTREATKVTAVIRPGKKGWFPDPSKVEGDSTIRQCLLSVARFCGSHAIERKSRNMPFALRIKKSASRSTGTGLSQPQRRAL